MTPDFIFFCAETSAEATKKSASKQKEKRFFIAKIFDYQAFAFPFGVWFSNRPIVKVSMANR
jgi:hypothetical protein